MVFPWPNLTGYRNDRARRLVSNRSNTTTSQAGLLETDVSSSLLSDMFANVVRSEMCSSQASAEQKVAQQKFDAATKDAMERFKELQRDEAFMETTCRSIRSG